MIGTADGWMVSAPRKAGYKQRFCSDDTKTGEQQAREKCAELLGVPLADMVEMPLNGVTYCYASQADCDADLDGAYAVSYREVVD